MKDEEFVFHSDCREKKITARSARNKRTHNGKRGRVRFPSDNLSRKEIQAMNSEVKSYRLNEPMKWAEFKEMPDDIKVTYIKALRQKYGVSDSGIAKMLGIGQWTVSKEVQRLGISVGRHNKKPVKFDSEGWVAWCNGAPVPTADPVDETPETDRQKASLEDIFDAVPVPEIKVLPVREEKRSATPCSGSMIFEGRIEDVLNTVSVLLGGANVHISITWDVLPDMAAGRMADNDGI